MPRHDHIGSPAAGPSGPAGSVGRDSPERPSRRAVLRTAAGAGAAGVAATALSGLGGTALAAQSKADGSAGRDASRPADEADRSEQIVVHVKDAKAGEIDVFGDSTVTRLRDPELAARLVRASRQ